MPRPFLFSGTFDAKRPHVGHASGTFGTKRHTAQALTRWVGVRQPADHAWAVALNPFVPEHLKLHPFTLAEARSAGISRKCLFGRSWRRLASELYCWAGWIEEPWALLAAWHRLLPADAMFSGPSAAWLWGAGFQPTNPVEVVVSPASGIRPRRGLTVRRCQIPSDEVAVVRGLPATTLLRTLRDVCLRKSAIDALISIDAALYTRQTSSNSLIEYSRRVSGRPGAPRLLELAGLAAPAESPMETRLRWLLLRAGLPRPEVQPDLSDAEGRFIARADLYYPGSRLVIEYDGVNHRDRLVEDNRRQNLLINAGFRVLRFAAADLDRPGVVAAQVKRAILDRDV